MDFRKNKKTSSNNERISENAIEINLMDPSSLPNRSSKAITWLLLALIFIIISGILFGIALLWQWRFDILAICNAFYFSGILLFSLGLIVYATNNNIFSPLVYGTKTFFLMFAGRKPKLSYYDYFQDNKNHQIPKHLILYPIIASVPNLIVAIILHIYFNNYIYPYL